MFQSIQEPHCMSCKVPWNSDFISQNYSKFFVDGELRKYWTRTLMERERARLPQLQEEINWNAANMEMVLLENVEAFYQRRNIHNQNQMPIQQMIQELLERFPNLRLNDNLLNGPIEYKVVKSMPVRRCLDENCTGFVMRPSYACGMCYKKMCQHCMADLSTDDKKKHECKQEDVETTKLLLKNTKPCPECGLMINKVNGCSQMWCTGCHTTFNWETLEKEVGHTHNPHYFEWMRRQDRQIARAPEDVVVNPCNTNQLPTIQQVQRTLSRSINTNQYSDPITGAQVVAAHIQGYEIPMIDRHPEAPNFQRSLNIKYLQKEITEDEWGRRLYLNHRAIERRRGLRQVMELFYTTVCDALISLVQVPPPRSMEDIERVLLTVKNIAEYCNESFQAYGRRYGNKYPIIDLKKGMMVWK